MTQAQVNGFREEIPDDDPRLKLSQVVRKIAEALNKVNFLKEDYGDRPLMAPADWEPARTQGLGSLLDVDKLAEHLDLSARGFSPFKDKFQGISDRIPDLQSKRKQALSLAFDLVPGPGPTEAKAAASAAGAAAGVIRRKGDNITPEVAKGIAEKLIRKPVTQDQWLNLYDNRLPMTPEMGPVAPHQDPAIAEELQQKLARYIQRSAGTESDPLQSARLWQRGQPEGWYGVEPTDPLDPVATRDFAEGAQQLEQTRMFRASDPERENLPKPEGTMGKATDEIAATLLAPGVQARKNFETSNEISKLPEDMQRRLDAFYQSNADAYIPRAYEEPFATRVQKEAVGALVKSGIREDKIAEVLATMPPGTGIGLPDGWNNVDSRVERLGSMLEDPTFQLEYARIPANKRQQMDFPRVINELDPKLLKAVREYDKSLQTPVIHTYKDGSSWKELKDRPNLRREGMLLNHCIGRPDQPYCGYIESGKGAAFALRDKDNKPLVTVYADKLKEPDELIPPFNGGTDQAQAILTKAWLQTDYDPQKLKTALWNAGVGESRADRLAGIRGEVTPDDLDSLRSNLRAASREPDDREYQEILKALGYPREPNPRAGEVKYKLNQIKAHSNAVPHNWTAAQQDEWVPKINEFVEQLHMEKPDKDDVRSLARATSKVEERKLAAEIRRMTGRDVDPNMPAGANNWRPEVAHPPEIQAQLDAFGDAARVTWREVEDPDGNPLSILDGGEINGHAFWWVDAEMGEAPDIWAAPMFRNGNPDFQNSYPIDEMLDVQENPELGRIIRLRFGQE